jgi:hypothetical protein
MGQIGVLDRRFKRYLYIAIPECSFLYGEWPEGIKHFLFVSKRDKKR